MANYLRPRRGKRATATSTLTASNPLKRGEVFFEVPTGGIGSGAGNIVMGDGATKYDSLPYFINGSLIGTTDISSIGNGTITGAISSLNNDLANKQTRPDARAINAETDLLNIDIGSNTSVRNQPLFFSEDAGSLTNKPPGAGTPFYGWREVRSEMSLTTVTLHEMYPNYQNTWVNTYDANVGNWYGWRCP